MSNTPANVYSIDGKNVGKDIASRVCEMYKEGDANRFNGKISKITITTVPPGK